MKIKIAEIADIHFGAITTMTMQLLDDLKTQFIDWLKQNAPDVNIIAICGDLYHLKLSLDSTEAKFANHFIDKLQQSFPNTRIILIKGTKAHDLNQLDIFSSRISENFKIYNTVEEDYYGDNFKYLVIPEEYYPDKSVYDKYLKTSEKYDWCFFHGMFSFAGGYALQTGNKFNKICFNSSEFENVVYGKVVGGHIHIPMEEGKIQYTGSFERWRHGEEEAKGFRYHEYDTETKKVIKDLFIENKNALIYKTISYKDLHVDDLETLTKELDKLRQNCCSLRIKIGKTEEITDQQSENLVAACLQFNNVVLLKESKSVRVKNTEEEQRISEERKKRIKEYEGLDFMDITIKYARDVLHKQITEKQIQEVLE
jgi:hypothetical protein